jgi:probable rRNA maturation factor
MAPMPPRRKNRTCAINRSQKCRRREPLRSLLSFLLYVVSLEVGESLRARLVILQKSVVGMTALSLTRFVSRARRAAGLHGSVNVLVTSNGDMKSLNRRFRGKNQPTDVLSFPAPSDDGRKFAGDIAICAEIAAQNARALGHTAALEVKILALHGILHLRGYDHERDHGQMARREQALRRALRLPVGLIERAETRAAVRQKRQRA